MLDDMRGLVYLTAFLTNVGVFLVYRHWMKPGAVAMPMPRPKAFCSHCGAAVDEQFCGACGTRANRAEGTPTAAVVGGEAR